MTFKYCERFDLFGMGKKGKNKRLFRMMENTVRSELSLENIFEKLIKFEIMTHLVMKDNQVNIFKEFGIAKDWFFTNKKFEKTHSLLIKIMNNNNTNSKKNEDNISREEEIDKFYDLVNL